MAFPTGYSLNQPVTIDKDKVGATETDFPILLTEANFVRAGADIFDTVRSDGGDIRITLSDGTTQLAREVVSIDTGAKTIELNVKIPSLSSSVDTVIRVWYNGIDTEPAEDSTYGKENTWVRSSGHTYGMVQHMDDTTTSTITDSTSNDNDGTKIAANEPIEIAGLLGSGNGRAQDFDGVNDRIDIADSASIDFADEDFFIEVVFKVDSLSNAFSYFINKNYGGAGVAWYGFAITSAGSLLFSVDDGTNIAQATTSNGIIVTDTTYRIIGIRDTGSSLVRLYINGSQVDTSSDSAVGSVSNSNGMRIGQRYDLDTTRDFNGKEDEIRVGSGILSADWISTQNNNQDSPSTFYSVGDEQGGDVGVSVELSSNFDVHNILLSQRLINFDIFNSIAAQIYYNFDINNLVQSATSFNFDVRNITSAELITVFDILSELGVVTQENISVFDIRNSLLKDVVAVFDIRNAITQGTIVQFGVRNLVSDTTSLNFDIRSLVGAELIAVYDSAGSTSNEIILVFDIGGGKKSLLLTNKFMLDPWG